MIRFFDASALAKRYVNETGSRTVRQLLGRGNPAVCRLSEVEVASALFRRAREDAISVAERDRALRALQEDFGVFYVVEVSREISAGAMGLLRRYALRAGDSIQLAACLYLQELLGASIELIAYDARLNEAARREGIAVVT